MFHNKRREGEYTASDLSRLKGQTAIVFKESGQGELCKIKNVVYDSHLKQYSATIKKSEKKSPITFSKTLDSFINFFDTRVSHVPMSKVYPLIDVKIEENKHETWQVQSRSKVEQVEYNGYSMKEIILDELQPGDFVVFIQTLTEPLGPIIGKVRKVFERQLNILTSTIVADVLVPHGTKYQGKLAIHSKAGCADFGSHIMMNLREIKRLGQEILLTDDELSTANGSMVDSPSLDNEESMASSLLNILEEGPMIRECHMDGRYFKFTDHRHPEVGERYMFGWRVCYSSHDHLVHTGDAKWCLQLNNNDLYFEVTFDKDVIELDLLMHAEDCNKSCGKRRFLVNEKKCILDCEAKILTVRTLNSCANIGRDNAGLATSSPENSKAETQPTELKLNTTENKLQHLGALMYKSDTDTKIGIEGGINSCYLDVSMFIMFCFDISFDECLDLNEVTQASWDAEVINTLKEIASSLRNKFYVQNELTTILRKNLCQINSGFMSSFMDVEELFSALFTQIFPRHFFELNNGGRDIIHQLVIPMSKDDTASVPDGFKTSQDMLEQSFKEYGVKFRSRPYPVFIMKLPYCDGKAYFGSKGVIPSKWIDLLPVMDSNVEENNSRMELYAVICLKSSHYTCFVKTGFEDSCPWVYFDSGSAKRTGNIVLLPEFGKDLEAVENEPYHAIDPETKGLQHYKHVGFMLKHIYMCFYRHVQ